MLPVYLAVAYLQRMETTLTNARLVSLVRSYFDGAGIEVAIENGVARVPTGGVFGLNNIGLTLDALPEDAWPQTVASHFDSLLAVEPELPGTFEEASNLLRIRLSVVEDADLFPGIETWRPIGGGLREMLMFKLDVGARNVPPDVVEAWGADPDMAWKTGRDNTFWDEPHERNVLQGPNDEVINMVTGSFFASSMLLDIGRFGLAPHGYLAMIPSRDILLFCRLDYHTMSRHLRGMLNVGGIFHVREPGPISPDLYWWHEGAIRRIAKGNPNGQFVPESHSAFSKVLHVIERTYLKP